MVNFNPLSMPGPPDNKRQRNFRQFTKTGANSADFGLKYYFCGRLEAD
jgi:hypothetical protein